MRHFNVRAIDDYVRKRHLCWPGHMARLDFDKLPRKMLSSWLCTKCPVGAPEYTYSCDMFKSLKEAAVNLNSWHELAHDKQNGEKWLMISNFWFTTIIYYFYLFTFFALWFLRNQFHRLIPSYMDGSFSLFSLFSLNIISKKVNKRN